ncbi:MAG TPA: hypothetical protein DCL54_00240 [Alphaproteobacteria bacterium]|nr:hypothetical protein [Alphaproteobacteria bacterium]
MLNRHSHRWIKSVATHLYDGVGEPNFYERLARNIHETSGLGFTQLTLIGREDMAHRETAWSEDHAKQMEEYRQHIVHVDPRVPAYLARPGRFRACWEVIDTQAFERLDFVGAWVDRKDVNKRWGAASVWHADGDHIGVLALLRSRQEGFYQRDELEAADVMRLHLKRAVKLHLFLSSDDCAVHPLRDRWAGKSSPVFILGAERRILAYNRAAEALLKRGDVVHKRWGVLNLRNMFAAQTLDQALASAASYGEVLPKGTLHVPLHGFGGQMTWTGDVIPVAPVQRELGFDGAALAILTLRELRVKGDAVFDRLRFLGLTRDEAIVARSLRQHHDVKRVAAALNLEHRTVRAMVQAIFEKTGTRDWTEFLATAKI